MNFYTTFNRGKTDHVYATILLKLRLTFIILITVILQASATSYAQITLNEKAAPLEQVIQKIRKQTGYDFFYSASILSNAKPITLKVNNVSVEEALKACFAGQSITYTIEQKTIILRSAPERVLVTRAIVVTGQVLDENGKPIPGASVKVKGSKDPAIATDRDGNFKIIANSEDDLIVVSYVGYETKEVKASKSPLTIKMVVAENKMDQVVISTGIFKKVDKSFTGASVTVTAKELQQFGNRNLITSLRNIDPSFNIVESNSFGSNPNRLPEIQMRGNSSLPNVDQLTTDEVRVGLNTPLIILDGFQSTLQKMLDINENEVESITLLKDAAATAIYGSRGSNGVVVITTKSPQAGKLRINFKSDLNIETPDLTNYNVLKSREKLELELKAGYYNNARAEVDLPLKRYYNFVLNEVNRGVETDWMAIPVNTGVGQRHNIRLEGGDQSFRYSASAQLNDIKGVMKESNRTTFNGAITLAYTYKNIKFRNNLQVSQGNSAESPYGKFSDFTRLNPYWRPYDDKGNVLKVLGDPSNFDYTSYWNSLPTNPLYNATLNTFDKSETSEIINNFSIEWTLIKDLVVRGQLGLSKKNVQYDAFRPADHTFFNNYAIADVFRKGDYKYRVNNGLGYDGSFNLAYSKMINVKHVIFAGFDFNIRQDKNSDYSFIAEGFPNANFDFVTMGLQYAKDGKPFGTESFTRALGFTSNVNYTYDNRYFVDASFRVDGSSQFGGNKRFAPFWSTGIGWNLHNEKFLQDNKFVNRLKIRGSAGITGSQNFKAYQAQSTYGYYTNDRYFNWLGSFLYGLGNEDLQWQQTLKYNIGTDAEFLNRRLKLNADYYIEKTNDLVSFVNLPASNGFTSYIENIGSLKNKGYEIKATGFLIARPKLTWSITSALIHNRNEILETSKAYEEAQASLRSSQVDINKIYVKGYSSNAIWVVPSLGIDPSTGKELYLGKDGLPTYTWNANNIAAVGSTDPKFFGNISTMLRYKDFTVNASFAYTYGGQMYNQTLSSKVEAVDYKYNVDSRVYDNRWQKPGDITAFKGLLVTGITPKTSRFVQDENTFRLQNVNLQYDFRSSQFVKHLGFQAFSVAANMADVFYLSTIRQERGTTYPFAKQFSLTLNATF
ncbi:MAG TPA: SusC/RagA family TonB-linked outer membrane protein [Pedobacter sp.]|nr:SusC/RagA family TonB-linked outer membrane protein [Pedobacter sp.]